MADKRLCIVGIRLSDGGSDYRENHRFEIFARTDLNTSDQPCSLNPLNGNTDISVFAGKLQNLLDICNNADIIKRIITGVVVAYVFLSDKKNLLIGIHRLFKRIY